MTRSPPPQTNANAAHGRSAPSRPDWLTRQLETAQWPDRNKSRLVRAANIDWHVQFFGNTAQPVCLMLHGTGASGHSMGPLARLFSEDWHVVVPDLPGHGFTRNATSQQLSLPGMSAALTALLDALDIRPANAVGHSAGAAVLLQLSKTGTLANTNIFGVNSALEQIAGASILSPLAKLLFANPLTPRVFAFQARFGGLSDRLIRATGSHVPANSMTCYRHLFNTPKHVRGALGMMAGWDLAPLIKDLGTIESETLLIAARDDRMVPARVSKAAAHSLPNGRFLCVQNGGHLVHEEEPQIVANLIRETSKAAA
ncbi:magnesium chelatase accessory protein [Roseibium hamelinense]|uniref:Magnesium chelatase accessory protein n=1 Tax=Roseibium hamelinense TaxID=150831 RepID=A0A562SXY6_9HYPH|nr:alpha/beta fold hydrolase BchO [Roseibium hamelinense]MTI44834.1 alpha/beta fold hydrolase [Roseibium hamelinense]TWI85973.1 magnesium chelatase accessory protein [Roseibium hamelinense]